MSEHPRGVAADEVQQGLAGLGLGQPGQLPRETSGAGAALPRRRGAAGHWSRRAVRGLGGRSQQGREFGAAADPGSSPPGVQDGGVEDERCQESVLGGQGLVEQGESLMRLDRGTPRERMRLRSTSVSWAVRPTGGSQVAYASEVAGSPVARRFWARASRKTLARRSHPAPPPG